MVYYIFLFSKFGVQRCILSGVTIGPLLGGGAFGEGFPLTFGYLLRSKVFKGTWSGCEIAAKRTRANLSQKELIAEAETAMIVRHPNCVQFFGVLGFNIHLANSLGIHARSKNISCNRIHAPWLTTCSIERK